jgi:hypothetical protein
MLSLDVIVSMPVAKEINSFVKKRTRMNPSKSTV